MKAKRGPLVTLAEAAQEIGFDGSPNAIAKRLRRAVEAKERSSGRVILVRLRGPNGNVTHKVSMWFLRRRMPELFDLKTEAELAAMALVRKELEPLKRDMAILREEMKFLKKGVAKAIVRMSVHTRT